MSRDRCGHCYRWATTTIYRRSLWRVLGGRPAEVRRVCAEHLDAYRGPRFRVVRRAR